MMRSNLFKKLNESEYFKGTENFKADARSHEATIVFPRDSLLIWEGGTGSIDKEGVGYTTSRKTMTPYLQHTHSHMGSGASAYAGVLFYAGAS